MARHRSIRNRRRKSRLGSGFELQLTSLMDILVIMVVFLLKSYATSLNTFSPAKGIEVPKSVAELNPPDSAVIVVTPEAITFENERIVEFIQTAGSAESGDATYELKKLDTDDDGRRIIALFDALSRAKEKSEQLRIKSQARDAEGNPLPFDGIIAIQADRRVPYATLRKIMYTAAVSGYRTFRFLALKKET